MHQAANLMRSADHLIALTGAGISTPSGIPDFRSPSSGLWRKVDPIAVASIWGFHDNPKIFYHWFFPLAKLIRTARPNPAHIALAQLETLGRLDLLITQNIDGLHQKAGSSQVVELHGHLRGATCIQCHQAVEVNGCWASLEQGEVPRCPHCNGLVKPDAVLFGEPVDYDNLKAAQEAALHCDVMIAAGSSLEVDPAADLPHLACHRGAGLIIINQGPTLADSVADVIIRADVSEILPRLVRMCQL